MIGENADQEIVAMTEQIRVLAESIGIMQDYGNALTAGERTARLASLGVARYMHNHNEIVRIFNAVAETEYQPYGG